MKYLLLGLFQFCFFPGSDELFIERKDLVTLIIYSILYGLIFSRFRSNNKLLLRLRNHLSCKGKMIHDVLVDIVKSVTMNVC